MSTQAVNPRYEILEATPGPDTPPYEFAKARDREEGRVVALQVVPAEIFGTNATLRRDFQNAVQKSQTLVHPSILQVFDQGVADGTGDLYVVREQLRGITLQERIRGSRRSRWLFLRTLLSRHRSYRRRASGRDRAWRSAARSCAAQPGRADQTADFAYGALVAAQGDEPNRAAYLAPELGPNADGEEAATFAGDIYALGAMLYEMLTGVLPLAGGDAGLVAPRCQPWCPGSAGRSGPEMPAE